MTIRSQKPLFLILVVLLAGVCAQPVQGQEGETACGLTEEKLTQLSEEMHHEVEELRGMKFKHPVDVGLYSEEELRAFLQQSDPGEGDRWNEEARSEAALKMIGIMPADCDPKKTFEEVMMAFVPDGIYDHETKALRLVKQKGMDAASLSTRLTLAHELTHALDDQHFGIAELYETGGTTSDTANACGAVIEGSAVTLQERYNIKAKASGRFDLNKYQKDHMNEIKQMKPLFEAPPYVATFMARFPCGVRFLQRGDPRAMMELLMGARDPGSVNETVRASATNPPRSFEQVLHPEKYWQIESCDEPVIVNDEDVEKILADCGLHVVHRDTLGELFCAVLTSEKDKTINPMAMGMPGYWTNEGAAGWGGDRLFLLAAEPLEDHASEPPVNMRVLWLTLWDRPVDCTEFVDQYQKHRNLPSRAVFELGERGAVFFFDFPDAQRKSLEEQLINEPPKLTCNEKPWSTAG